MAEKMKLEVAREKAENLIEQMRPSCERIEVAGSILRGKPEVSDIEIVCVSKWDTIEVPDGLFGMKNEPVNRLFNYLMYGTKIRWVYKRDGELFDAVPKPDAKMMKGILPCGAQLDLFIACPENFGLIKMIRTGNDEFSKAMVTRALKINKRVAGGFMHGPDGYVLDTREEIDVFEKLGVQWIEPQFRNSEADMKIVGFSMPKATVNP